MEQLTDIAPHRIVTSVDQLIKPRLSNAFGDIVRRQRMNLGFSQHDVAERADLTPWEVKQIERGREAPTLMQRRSLAAALGLDDDALRRLPVEDVPVGARRRDVDLVFDTSGVAETLGGKPVAPCGPSALRNFALVLSSHGETALMRDLNEAVAVIDGRYGATVEATETITHDGEWFTTILRYRSPIDLFPDAAADLPDPTAFVEPDQTPEF